MKTFFTILAGFLLLSSNTFAQGLNKIEPQQFWETNIQSILNGDMDAVVSQSHFPMSTFEGDWSKNDFIDAYEVLFDEMTLDELRLQSYRDIESFEDNPGEISYMLVIYTEREIEGELFESTTFLSFKKFDGVWKLYDIDMAG